MIRFLTIWNQCLFYLVTYLVTAILFVSSGNALPNNPIVFVTSPPSRNTFSGLLAMIGNHRGTPGDAGRGGDLWIRYPDGTLKNLTLAAGFGIPSSNDSNMIAVRDPSPSWDGAKIIFSMVVGVPNSGNGYQTFWQIYEATRLGLSETPLITRVSNQPANYNNVSPIYDSSNRILFISDRPPGGNAALYPRMDEYEDPAGHANTGIWRLNPANGVLVHLDNAPSGDFDPIIDSSGRIIFSRWDHLQRDFRKFESSFSVFKYSDETASAQVLNDSSEVFPEPVVSSDPDMPPNGNEHEFNLFFPWQMNQDGSALETLNHIGRQELSDYFEASFVNDPNLDTFYNPSQIPGSNPRRVNNVSQLNEDPTNPGVFYAVNADEFHVHSAGQIISIQGPPTLSPDQMVLNYITHIDTSHPTNSPSVNHSGLYRDPLKLSDGTLISAHTFNTVSDAGGAGLSNFIFRLRTLTQSGQYWIADTELTPGISKSISSNTGSFSSYNGVLRELFPVELRARIIPQPPTNTLATPELTVFNSAGVAVSDFQQYLFQNNLALIVSRNVTTRDDGDKQQPYNLRVPNGVQTLGAGGTVYNISDLQIFQGDFIRGIRAASSGSIYSGRRVLPQFLHESAALNLNQSILGSVPGSVRVGSDGSVAAFVPARKPLSWQLTSPTGAAVVRERFWLTFQPGEIRVCASCHGVNTVDQAGHAPPTNPPQALLQLLTAWKDILAADPTPTPSPSATPSSSPSVTPTPTATPDETPDPRADDMQQALGYLDELSAVLKVAKKSMDNVPEENTTKLKKILKARKLMRTLGRDFADFMEITDVESDTYPNLNLANAIKLKKKIKAANATPDSEHWKAVAKLIKLLKS